MWQKKNIKDDDIKYLDRLDIYKSNKYSVLSFNNYDKALNNIISKENLRIKKFEMKGQRINLDSYYTKDEIKKHFDVCNYLNPYICPICYDIYKTSVKKYKIKKFNDLLSMVGITLRHNNDRIVKDKLFFLNAFTPLIYKELHKYNYKDAGITVYDLRQDAYIILLTMFNDSKYRLIDTAKFVSYIANYFPLKLLQRYMKYKKKYQQELDFNWQKKVFIKYLKNPIMDENNKEDVLNFYYDMNYLYIEYKDIIKSILSDYAQDIFNLYFLHKYTKMDIALLMCKTEKQINDMLYFIKKKVGSFLKRQKQNDYFFKVHKGHRENKYGNN